MVRISLAAVAFVVLVPVHAFSQSQDVSKFEVAGEFTTLGREAFPGTRVEPGFGGRVTYNINRHFGVEGAAYLFPRRCLDCSNNGRIVAAVGGIKVGKRFETWGIFAKARPGIVSFSEGDINVMRSNAGPFPIEIEFNRLNAFATDLGGVVEFYPSKRVVVRFDAGDTIIHVGRRTRNFPRIDPVTETLDLVPFSIPSRTTHNFQFTVSVGFRF